MSIVSVLPFNHLILCRSLLLPPWIFPSIRVFSNGSVLPSGDQSIGALTSASVLPVNIQNWFPLGLTGLISLQSKELSKSLLYSLIASILWCSALFMVQLSHPYVTTGNTITVTIWTFVSKLISLLFSMQSRFVIVFLPRSKHLLIWWLQSSSAVILEPKKIVCHCFHCFSIYLPWSDGTRCHDFHFFFFECWVLG